MNKFYSKYTAEQVEAALDCLAEGKIKAATCTQCGAPLDGNLKCPYCGTMYRYVCEEIVTCTDIFGETYTRKIKK